MQCYERCRWMTVLDSAESLLTMLHGFAETPWWMLISQTFLGSHTRFDPFMKRVWALTPSPEFVQPEYT